MLTATNKNLLIAWPTNIIGHVQAQYHAHGVGLGTNWSDLSLTSSPAKVLLTTTNAFYRVSSP